MKKLLFGLIVLVFTVLPVSANLVVDGGFETPHIDGGPDYVAFYDGETIGAWTVIGGQDSLGVLLAYDTVNTLPIMWDMLMPEGTQMLHIGESARDNTISQVVSGFSVGARYELSLAAMNWGSTSEFELTLQVYNADTTSYDLDVIDDMGGPTGPAVRDGSIQNTMPYTSHEFDASNTELELLITNPTGNAWTIDDVSINIVGTVVGSTDPTSLEVWENASQGTTSGTFTIVLNADPGVNPTDTITVTIDPNSNGNGVDVTVNGSTAPIDITFNETNWDTPQTITVAAIDDIWADGEVEVDQIGFSIVSTNSDPDYDFAVIPSVEVNIYDDDSDAIVVSKTSASIAEGGAGDSYTIELVTDPTDPVTIIVAADYFQASETDSNMITVPFDCQLTVNGGVSDTLVFTQKNVPQTVTVAAVDDSMIETDPHLITIENSVDTVDPIYSNISADNVDVSITENDTRAWSFGDDVALTVENNSFEDPCLADGGSAGFDPCNPIPGYEFWSTGQLKVVNPTAGEWAAMYKAGHQQAPDGEQVLDLGTSRSGTESAEGVCEYLIEPGPVSYSFELAVGVPEPNDTGAYLDVYVSSNEPAVFGRIVDPPPTFSLSEGDLVAGEWVDIKVCGFVEAESDFIGGVLSVGVAGKGVQVDNWRLTLGNHPCEGTCYPDGLPIEEGDLDQDCVVDLVDFSILALYYLDCTRYPGCLTSW